MLLGEYQEQWKEYSSAAKAYAESLIGSQATGRHFTAIHFKFSDMWWQYGGQEYNFPFIFPYVSTAKPDEMELRINTLHSPLKRKVNE